MAETVAEPAYDPLLLEELRDGLRSLRTAVVLLGLVSIAALAVALFALYRAEEDDGAGGNQRARIAELDGRVDELRDDLERTERQSTDESQVEAAQEDVSALRDQVDRKADAEDVAQLEQAVEELSAQGGDDQTAAQLTELSDRVAELERQVAELESGP